MDNNTLRDEWSSLADFMGEMILKYAAEVDFDSMPDPNVYLIQKKIIDFLKKYRRNTKCKKRIEVEVNNDAKNKLTQAI